MASKWDKIAAEAGEATKAELARQISSLTSLSDSEISTIMNKSGISKEDFAELLQVVKAASGTNRAKAEAIGNINKGVSALIEIVKKLL